jgi:capsular polysaccharide biosynthesis protein
MNLFDYGRILIRRAWIVVLAVVLVSGAAYGFSRTQAVEYKATQKVAILPARNDLGLVETLRSVMQNYVEYLYTNLRADEVIRRNQFDMTAGDLRSHATINSDPTTMIIQIDVELEDPQMAQDAALTWGQLLVEFRNERNSDLRQEDRIEAELLDAPIAGQSKPNTRTNVLAGAIMGLLLGGIVIFVSEFLEAGILRSGDDLKRWVNIPVLAAIPSETRSES